MHKAGGSKPYLKNKVMVNIRLGDVGVEILALDKPQEEFIHHLNVRPRDFQNWFILFGIEWLPRVLHGRRNRTEQILRKHVDNTRIHRFSDDRTIVGNVV